MEPEYLAVCGNLYVFIGAKPSWLYRRLAGEEVTTFKNDDPSWPYMGIWFLYDGDIAILHFQTGAELDGWRMLANNYLVYERVL